MYVETCPAYLNTVDGVSRWAARTGWQAAREALGWCEGTVQQVLHLGGTLRALAQGVRRGGRHLLLEAWQAEALRRASGASSSLQGAPAAAPLVLPLPAGLERLQAARGPRTLALQCPVHSDHDPSLVLWKNGGAQCLACGWRAAWKVTEQGLVLYSSTGSGHAELCRSNQDRHNKDLPRRGTGAGTGGAVGGLVAERSTCETQVGTRLTAWRDRTGEWRQVRTAGHRLEGGVLQALEVAERRSAGPVATERAQLAAQLVSEADLPARAALPDQLLSVSCMRREHWSEQWEAQVQRWMLLDLDDVEGLDRCGPALGEELLRVALADPEVGDEVAVVRTSPTGLQVWVRLAQPRHSPAAWCRLPAVRGWHRSLGERLLAVARHLGASGGHADPSACAAGRFGRRPGWRMARGALYRAHLLAMSGGGVRERVAGATTG